MKRLSGCRKNITWGLLFFAEFGGALCETRDFALRGVAMNDALGSAAHQLRLRRFERFQRCILVARRQRLFHLPCVAAEAVLPGMVDGGALDVLARAFLGGVDIGHIVSFGCLNWAFLATPAGPVNERKARTLEPQRTR